MSIRIPAALAVALTLAVHTAATAQTPAQTPPPLSAYGALPAVEHARVSPGGDRLALVTVAGDDRVLVVLDPHAGQMLGRIEVGLAKVRDLTWIGENNLMITTTSTQSLSDLGGRRGELRLGQIYDIERRRLVSVLQNASGVSPLLAGAVEVRRLPEGEVAFVRAFSFGTERTSLYRLDPASGRGREAVRLGDEIRGLVLDAEALPVAGSTYVQASGRWGLGFWNGRSFDEVWSTTAPLDPPYIMGLGRDGRSVLVSARRDDNRTNADENGSAVYEVNADGAWTPMPLGGRVYPLYHPVTEALFGSARSTDNGTEYRFLDPTASTAWTTVAGALDGRSPDLADWSDDMQTVLAYTSGPGDSGSYHLIDLERRTMNVVGQAYPSITGDLVGTVTPIEYAAADGLKIHGYLTLPPGVASPQGLPLVVLAHGGPASHDTMGFDWWAQATASRGYAVLQANFRGSTGYGQAFLEAGYGEWGRKMQTDLSDGVRYLAAQGVIDPARVCIVGASYGGYAALAGPTLDRGVYRCAISVAGVSDLRRMVESEAREAGRPNTETVRYWNRFMGASRLGDRAIDALSPARLADQADAPILLIHGKDDTVVPIEQSRLMADALRRAGKPVEFIELQGEDHWLSRSDTRQRMLEETLRFLQAHNPAN
ncbi:alpha/beta hydrolase family protein [Brevundimonas sp. FT23028]|uniref:alpha/beta hydrolase family protein n=1 Tax=Brevundimonas sp. FT23028 TaxID=3393748 RepID=UPI003B589E2C